MAQVAAFWSSYFVLAVSVLCAMAQEAKRLEENKTHLPMKTPRMKPKQTKANAKLIKASIAHWKRMRAKPLGKDHPFSDDCPLCRVYNKRTALMIFMNCDGCPVQRRTGYDGCAETPYGHAANIWADFKEGSRTKRSWQRAADKEIKFLESLL